MQAFLFEHFPFGIAIYFVTARTIAFVGHIVSPQLYCNFEMGGFLKEYCY